MTNDLPIACSLDASDLKGRLAEIADIGADSLISHDVEDGRQLLRFRADAATSERLQVIVAAESQCCSFLDIQLTAIDDELLLTIDAPDDAQPVAGDLALAFVGGRA